MQQMDRLKRLRTLMLLKHPFFASIMLNMPMIEDTSIPTAQTDMKSIWVNPDFIATLSDQVVLFVLAHEVGHVALMHGFRVGSRDWTRWNVACDYSWNLTLKDSGFEIWDKALCDEEFRNEEGHPMSADQIYAILEKEDEEAAKQGGQGQGQPQPGDGSGGGSGGQAPPPPPNTAGQPGNRHWTPMLGDLAEPECSGDEVAEDKLRKDIQQTVAQAATAARMVGNLSAGLERFVNAVLAPKIPWYEKVRHLMDDYTASEEENWSMRNRRFSDIFLPTDNSPQMGGIAIIGDSSGSIGDEEMGAYATHSIALAEDVKPSSIHLVWADAEICGVQEFERGDEILPRPKGGGGTDMRVPLKFVEQYEPKLVILFTDGYTPWPTEEPEFPLIVCCTTDKKVPIGDVVRI